MINNLKSEKGITLISLIVYVTVMLIIITIVGGITSYFNANVNKQYIEANDKNSETTLDLYLINDLKNNKISITQLSSDHNSQIKLVYKDDSYIIYTITDDGIYRNAVKIYDIPESDNLIFYIREPFSANPNTLIKDKQEIQIKKGDGSIFKSYIVNIVSRAVY